MNAAATPSSIATAVIRSTRRSTSVERRGMRVASSVVPSDGDNGSASVLPSSRKLAGGAGLSVAEVMSVRRNKRSTLPRRDKEPKGASRRIAVPVSVKR